MVKGLFYALRPEGKKIEAKSGVEFFGKHGLTLFRVSAAQGFPALLCALKMTSL